MKYINLSLVIASFKGEKKISNLMQSILNSSKIPSEIIIVCYSAEKAKYKHRLNRFNSILNIKIIESKIKNQIIK